MKTWQKIATILSAPAWILLGAFIMDMHKQDVQRDKKKDLLDFIRETLVTMVTCEMCHYCLKYATYMPLLEHLRKAHNCTEHQAPKVAHEAFKRYDQFRLNHVRKEK